MGFPSRAGEAQRAFVGPEAKLAGAGFACPRCQALVEELPCACVTYLPAVVHALAAACMICVAPLAEYAKIAPF